MLAFDPMDIRRIVVGLELGHLSDQAVARAMSLARSFDAELDVVHGAGIEAARFGALPHGMLPSIVAETEAHAREAARGKLALLVEDPAYAARPVDDYLHVSSTTAAEAVLGFAQEHGADLIVLGAHRHRKILDFGGTGRAVLARSTCPVWIEPAEARRFERILAPIDLSPFTELVLTAARDLASRFEVPVRVLHVFSPPQFTRNGLRGTTLDLGRIVQDLRVAEQEKTRQLVRAFDWGALPVETDFAEGSPSDEIVERSASTDLVVLGTHGHRGLVRAVLGSCAYRVLKHARGPILVVPQRAAARS